jgi:hypothetical protein
MAEQKTYEEWLNVIEDWDSAWDVMHNIPEKYKTLELCVKALKYQKENVPYDNLLIHEVPETLRVAVKEAVKKEEYSKAKEIPYQIWLEEIKNYKTAGKVLSTIPEEYKTVELCLKAIKKEKADAYPSLLTFVPLNLRTAGICLIAAKKNISAFEFIPDEFKTPELCLEGIKASLKEHYKFLPDIPQKIWEDPAFCLSAVEINYRALEKMPESSRSFEVCVMAVKKSGLLGYAGTHPILESVPEAIREEVKKAVHR